MNSPAVPLLQVQDLTRHYPVLRGLVRRAVGTVRAVDGVTFHVRSGETLGLVGESGSGKSTAGRVVVSLEPPTSGSVVFDGVSLGDLPPAERRRRRREVQMIFQDPYASLNPRMSVGRALAEPLEIHRLGDAAQRRERVSALLDRVGLPAGVAARYPHEFSGGQRQRIGIARALATNPRLVVADEPISALDVSIQAQIVNLLADLKEELGLTYLFIAHDLSMVRYLSDRVAVMYLGKLVEVGPREEVFDRPLHPYTRALIASIPVADPTRARMGSSVPVQGEAPDPSDPPGGCRFHPRCPFAVERCRVEEPGLRALEEATGRRADGTSPLPPEPHAVACHRAEELG